MTNSLFIRVGNQIINREQVCGVQYNTFSEPKHGINHTSKLSVFTTDGKEVIFFDGDADLMWDVFDSAALAMRD